MNDLRERINDELSLYIAPRLIDDDDIVNNILGAVEDALMSDEAVEAAMEAVVIFPADMDRGTRKLWRGRLRAALETALGEVDDDNA